PGMAVRADDDIGAGAGLDRHISSRVRDDSIGAVVSLRLPQLEIGPLQEERNRVGRCRMHLEDGTAKKEKQNRCRHVPRGSRGPNRRPSEAPSRSRTRRSNRSPSFSSNRIDGALSADVTATIRFRPKTLFPYSITAKTAS